MSLKSLMRCYYQTACLSSALFDIGNLILLSYWIAVIVPVSEILKLMATDNFDILLNKEVPVIVMVSQGQADMLHR